MSVLWLVFLACYLAGHCSFGLLINFFSNNIDLRQEGSGNVGASNVWRLQGHAAGLFTLLGDTLKGVAAVFLAKWLDPSFASICVGSLAVVLGHIYPLFFGFKGGKGVATSWGVMMVWSWPLGLFLAFLWLVVFGITRVASVASLSAVFVAPILWAAFFGTFESLWITLLGFFVALNHWPNIKRLKEGREPSFR